MATIPTSQSRSRLTRGFTLIELMVVLAITALIAVYQINKARAEVDDRLSTAAADNIKTLGQAVAVYISSNTAALATTTPADLTVAQLQAGGSCGTTSCLSNTFAASGWTGGYSIRIRKLTTTTPHSYEALICSVNEWSVNSKPRADLVGAAYQKVGGAGAMTYESTAGAYPLGSSTPLGIANYPFSNKFPQLCYFVSQTLTPLDSLYLRTDGTNSMMGELNMNANSIAAATTITASGNITTPSLIRGGTLTSTGDVNVGPGFSVASTGRLNVQAQGDLYLQPNANPSGSNTFLGGSGGSGNLRSTNGTVTAKNLVSDGNVTISSGGTLIGLGRLNVQADGDLYLQPNSNPSGSNTYVGGSGGSGNFTVNNNLTVLNEATVTNDVKITTLATRGSPPTTTSVKALLPKLVELYSYNVSADGQTVPVPVCPAGGTPAVFILPHVATGIAGSGLWGTDVRMTGPSGGVWTVVARDAQGMRIGVNSTNIVAPNFTAKVRTSCAF